jgi:tRNA pseudouridine55 synthase
MKRSSERPGPSGFLVVDKPAGWTSHDVVDAARRWLGTRRVGHLGTLDPLATGVLPLAIREATKLAPFLAAGSKRYRAVIRLGVETDTLDADGEVRRTHPGPLPDAGAVAAALRGFEGEGFQVPPMYSAVKQGGVPLHRLARRGEEVERAPRPVRITSLELLRCAPPELEVDVMCSPGTYVRVLAADLGAALGCGAHLAALRRLASGPFRIEQARPVSELEACSAEALSAALVTPVEALGLPVVALGPDAARRVAHGGDIDAAPDLAPTGARVAAVAPDGALLAVLELRADRALRPLRVVGVWPRVASAEPLG